LGKRRRTSLDRKRRLSHMQEVNVPLGQTL
jgi:hypothetical protein